MYRYANRALSNIMSSDSIMDRLGSAMKNSIPFGFNRGQIEIIKSPNAFYETLKDKIANANERVFLASLYLGKDEDELVECISKSMERNPGLKFYCLFDGIRGTREAPDKCSASLIAKLDAKFGERVDLRFYVTPHFTPLKRLLLPNRLNEGIGLQHMKIYGIDDEVILSGANLSLDYFTNRQDRYYLFKSKCFTDYYFDLHQLISKFSYRVTYAKELHAKYKINWPVTNKTLEPGWLKSKFIEDSSRCLTRFLSGAQCERGSMTKKDLSNFSTIVYPISQLTPLFSKMSDISTERPTVLNLIDYADDPSKSWVFTSGYFNMLPDIRRAFLRISAKKGTVITASSRANGFYHSRGASGIIPDVYSHLTRKFLRKVEKAGKSDTITLYEWQRGTVNEPGGWSYHAKGIWVSDNNEPVATIIGSSNYTKRAYSKDLETNALVITKDQVLQDEMKNEIKNLQEYSRPVTLQDCDQELTKRCSIKARVIASLFGKSF